MFVESFVFVSVTQPLFIGYRLSKVDLLIPYELMQSGASKKRVVSQKTRKTRFLALEGAFKMGLKKRRGAPIENLAARLCAHSEGMRILSVKKYHYM